MTGGPDKRPPGHKAPVQKATVQKATPLNNCVTLALYCVYRRQRKLQDITVDFKATVCEQFASTIFADLLQRMQTSKRPAFLTQRFPKLGVQIMKLRLGTTRSQDSLATVTRLCTAYWTTSGRTSLSCTLLWRRRHVDRSRENESGELRASYRSVCKICNKSVAELCVDLVTTFVLFEC